MRERFITALIIPMLFAASCDSGREDADLRHFDWEFSSPGEEGIDPGMLDSAFSEAGDLGYVDCLLVVRRGRIVAERYWNGYTFLRGHNVKSVSKSFLSAMVGIAMNEGKMPGMEARMMDYFPEYSYQGIDARKFDVTVRHLLTMRMGIDGEQNTLADVLYSDNWIRETIRLPLIRDPGESFIYNTLQTHLLCGILTKTSGMTALDYADSRLLEPMGISAAYWYRDPQGYYFGGSEMHFTPRDMAVLGLLYLGGGVLNGRKIVPAEWVELSLTRTWAEDSPQWGVLENYNYGLLWWLGEINGYGMFMALGYGGQTIQVYPELDLIVVTTAEPDIGWDVDHETPILELVSEYILPAVD